MANYNSSSISVISDATYTVTQTVPIENQPQGIIYAAGAKKVFVTYSESRRVSVISDPSDAHGSQNPSAALPSPSVPELPHWVAITFAAVGTVASIMVVTIALNGENKHPQLRQNQNELSSQNKTCYRCLVW